MLRRTRQFLRWLSFEERVLLIAWIIGLWKLFATNWIVVTDYTYMGSEEVRSYIPPSSPMWNPPEPDEIAPGAKSWILGPFFDGGGWGGPVGEPVLKIHWVRIVIEAGLSMGVLLWISSVLVRRK